MLHTLDPITRLQARRWDAVNYLDVAFCAGMPAGVTEDVVDVPVRLRQTCFFLQLPEGLDMTWDDGTRNIEPVMDIYASDHISLVRSVFLVCGNRLMSTRVSQWLGHVHP